MNNARDPKALTSVNGLTIEQLKNLPEVKKFLQNKSQTVTKTLTMRLWNFHKFTVEKYNLSIHEFVRTLKKQGNVNDDDVYQTLNDYVTFRSSEGVEDISIGYYTRTARKFMTRNGIKIPLEDFKDNVTMPKKVKRQWYDIKEDIIEILTCPMTERLKTYLMMLAATGMRPSEPLYLTINQFNFESDPPTVFINGQTTKMKIDRKNFLTKEVKKVIQDWIKFKYRKRKIVHKNNGVVTWRTEQPEIDNKDLIFGMRNHGYKSNPKYVYNDLLKEFTEIRKRLHLNQMENRNNTRFQRHKITFQSFRRRAKKVIEQKAGWSYSEWFIGHSGSDYWATENGEKEAIDTFKQIEPYLTYLDVTTLKASNAALESQQQVLGEDLIKTRELTEQRSLEIEAKYSKRIEDLESQLKDMKQIMTEISNRRYTLPLKTTSGNKGIVAADNKKLKNSKVMYVIDKDEKLWLRPKNSKSKYPDYKDWIEANANNF